MCLQVAGMLDLLRTQGRWAASARLAYQVCYNTSSQHTTLLRTVTQYDRIIACIAVLSTFATAATAYVASSTSTATVCSTTVCTCCMSAINYIIATPQEHSNCLSNNS
jgi:hypothetical protein